MLDIEKALLGKLTEVDAIQQCWDRGVRSVVFEDPVHQRVYDFAIDYWHRNGMTLAPTRGAYETQFDREQYRLESSPEALSWLIDQLQRRYQTNQAQQIILQAGAITVEDPAAALTMLHEEAWRAKELTTPRRFRVDMAANVADRRRRYIEEAQQVRQTGAPLGLSDIDEHTGGILPGEVALVGAYTKTGKSWTLLQSTVAAHRAEFFPYVATLEMPVPQFELRLDAINSGVGYNRMHRKILDQTEMRVLHQAQDELAARGPLIVERPPEGERTVLSIMNKARQSGANYVVIDQLSWLEPRKNYRERRDQYKELIYDLKNEASNETAGELPVLIAAQYNRAAVSTKGERGGLHNLANAADIEQTIDIAFGLHRTRELRANNSMLIDILGARRADIKSWVLGWYLDTETSIFVRGEYTEDGSDE